MQYGQYAKTLLVGNEMGFTFSLENAFPKGFLDSVRGMNTFAGECVSSKQNTAKEGFPKNS